MKNYSNSLFKYADNSDTEDFEPPQPIRTVPIKSKLILTSTAVSAQTSMAKNQINSENAIVPINKQTEISPITLLNDTDTDTENKTSGEIWTQNISNFMQTFKQNPVGMIMGAKLANCTININFPK